MFARVVAVLDKAGGLSQAHQHTKDYRPWGWFESLIVAPGYQVKRLHVDPGARLSLQSHQHRSEHWVVVAGTATVVINEREKQVNTNESVYINVGDKHRLANDTDQPLVVIEVQTGSYLGEDDIVRYQDDFLGIRRTFVKVVITGGAGYIGSHVCLAVHRSGPHRSLSTISATVHQPVSGV